MIATLVLTLTGVLLQDDVTIESLKRGTVVSFVMNDRERIIAEFLESNDDAVVYLDLETLQPREIPKSQIKLVRANVSQAIVLQQVSVGRWLGWQISKKLEDATTPQTIASIQQGSVFVTSNQDSGLRVKDEVFVFRKGEPIPDPMTGEILGTPKQKIAKLEVMDVAEHFVTCRQMGEFNIELNVGDIVRPVKPRSNVAVLPLVDATRKPTTSGLTLANEIIDSLNKLGVETLERDRLDQLLNEQRLQDPLLDGETSRIGKLLGATTLVTGTILEKPSDSAKSIISVRLLDVSTGQVINSLETEISTKTLDRRRAEKSEAIPLTAPSKVGNTFLGIEPFRRDRKSITFLVPKNAKKVEVSFFNDKSGEPQDKSSANRIPYFGGKLSINGTQVIAFVKTHHKKVNGTIAPYRLYKLFDGKKMTEIDFRLGDQKASEGTIDVTPFVKRGENNVLTYSHSQKNYGCGVRIWITE